MLKLTRRIGETIRIGDEIALVILAAKSDVVRIGVQGGIVCRDVLAENETNPAIAAESKNPDIALLRTDV